MLWQNIDVDATTQVNWWRLDSAYPSHAECVTRRDKQFNHLAKIERNKPGTAQFKENPDLPGYMFERSGERYIYVFNCLPDTIDPREKKD